MLLKDLENTSWETYAKEAIWYPTWLKPRAPHRWNISPTSGKCRWKESSFLYVCMLVLCWADPATDLTWPGHLWQHHCSSGRDIFLLEPRVTFLLEELLHKLTGSQEGRQRSFLSLPCRSLDRKDFAQKSHFLFRMVASNLTFYENWILQYYSTSLYFFFLLYQLPNEIVGR